MKYKLFSINNSVHFIMDYTKQMSDAKQIAKDQFNITEIEEITWSAIWKF